MKHQKLIALNVVLLLLAAMSLSVYAASAEAPKGTPVIDGAADDIWSQAEAYPVALYKEGTADDVTSEFKMMWDNDYLYIIVFITDPDIAYDAIDTYKKDGIQLYFDFTNQFAASYGEINGGEYTLYLRDSKDELPTLSEVNGDASNDDIAQDILYEYKLTADGYIIEARFDPTLNYGALKMAEGTEFAFDIQVNDQKSDSTERAAAYGWTDDANQAWQTPSVLGSMKLTPAAAVAEEPPAAEEAVPEVDAEIPVEIPAPATADMSGFISLITAIALAGSVIGIKRRKQ